MLVALTGNMWSTAVYLTLPVADQIIERFMK